LGSKANAKGQRHLSLSGSRKRSALGHLLADRLYFLGITDTKHRHIEDLAASLRCDISSKACAYRECENCKGNTVHLKQYDEHVSTTWYQSQPHVKQYVKPGQDKVKTAKRIIKAQCSGTVKTLIKPLDSYLKRRLCKHIFNLRQQFKAARTLRDTLQVNEAIIQIDFSENYQCRYKRKVQSAHCGASKSQITLHTGVMYTSKQSISFCTLSDSKLHDACAVWLI